MLTLFTILAQNTTVSSVTYAPVNLGFTIPAFDAVLTFIIRLFFIIAGIIAIFYLLLGAFAWITSGGNKENVDKARDKIMNAVVGLILIFVVLAVATVVENMLFPANCGLGIMKNICFPKLIQ